MNENEILKGILQDVKIGWWKANLSMQTIYLSEQLRSLLGVAQDTMCFEEFQQQMETPDRESVVIQSILTEEPSYERVFSFAGDDGRVWLKCTTLKRETAPNGESLTWGYARQIAVDDVEMTQMSTRRMESLLNQLSSISQTLLSLLHNEKADEAIDKILSEILTMFNGSRAYIVEFDWANRMNLCTYEVTANNISGERDTVNGLSMDEVPWWCDRIMAGHSIVLTNLDEMPVEAAAERATLIAQGVKSLIVVPLFSRDKVWGYAGIDIVECYRVWSNEDYQWFSSLVNIVSLCLELQRSEQEAQTDRAYLQSLYRYMPLGYIRLQLLYDEQGCPNDYKIIDSNYAADEILERPRQSYVDRKGSELGRHMITELPEIIAVLRTGQHLESDAQIASSGRCVHTTLYTICRDEAICLISDVSEIRNAHQALFRNEKLLRNIYDNIPVGIELYDKHGILVDINNKDMELFGVRRKEEAVGLNFFENPNVPVQIREKVRNGEDLSFRLFYPFDGLGSYYSSVKAGYIDIYTTVSMIYDMQGQLANFILMNIDDTEINRAHSRIAEFENSFALVSRFGRVGYCRFDLLTCDGYAVAQWYRNLGEEPETPLSEVIGVYKHVDEADRRLLFEAVAQVRANTSDSFSLDLRICTGHAEMWTRVNVMRNPLNTDSSKIELVCVNYDVTELKLTEKNLIEAKNKAEVSDRLKSAFLANMSHEIRTPLNAIVGFSNLLIDAESLEEKKEYMRIVDENNDLLLKLISDILDLSKIEAGTFEFNYGVVDVNRMCREAMRTLGLKVQDKNVELRLSEQHEQCYMVGDKNRLMQIITNFLNNAFKFTDKGHITLGYHDHGKEDIVFFVEDTGTGISEENCRMIFDRFVKLNTFMQGTGLGLSICKSIAVQMGGAIGVESEEGKGARFWFRVPKRNDCLSDKQPGLDAEPDRECMMLTTDGKRPQLLIAEDTDSNFLLVSLMLKKEFEVVRARDGAEAVRLYRELRPDLIIMDIRMPIMDGLEATREIRSVDKNTPILAMTAFAYDRDRQKTLEAGCDDYLTKPITAELLKQKIHRLLRY